MKEKFKHSERKKIEEEEIQLRFKEKQLKEEEKLEKQRAKDIKLFLRKEQAILRKEQAERQRKFLEELKIQKQIEKFRIREVKELEKLEKISLKEKREDYSALQERIEKLKNKYRLIRDQKIRERVEALGVEQVGRPHRSTGGSVAGRAQLLLPWLLLNVNALLDQLLVRARRAKRRGADAEVCLGVVRVVCVLRSLHLERQRHGARWAEAEQPVVDNFFGLAGSEKTGRSFFGLPGRRAGWDLPRQPLRFTLRFRVFMIMIRTDDEITRTVGESQPMSWF